LNLDEKDDSGHTPFHYSILHSEPVVVNHLLDTYHIDLNIPFPDGRSIVNTVLENHYSTNTSSHDILKAVVANGAAYDKSQVLHIACKRLQPGVVKYLLNKGCDPNKPSSDGIYPLEALLYHPCLQSLNNLIRYPSTKLEVLKPSSISSLLHLLIQRNVQLATFTINKLKGPLLDEVTTDPYHPNWLQPMRFDWPFYTSTSAVLAAVYSGNVNLVKAIMDNKLFQEFVISSTGGTHMSYSLQLASYLQQFKIRYRNSTVNIDITQLVFMNSVDPSNSLKLHKCILQYTTDLNWNNSNPSTNLQSDANSKRRVEKRSYKEVTDQEEDHVHKRCRKK
jgi:ankyrin repeat protein